MFLNGWFTFTFEDPKISPLVIFSFSKPPKGTSLSFSSTFFPTEVMFLCDCHLELKVLLSPVNALSQCSDVLGGFFNIFILEVMFPCLWELLGE